MNERDRRGWIVAHDPLTVRAYGGLLGYDPRGTYAETYWLPLVGPTALWALRRLVPAALAAVSTPAGVASIDLGPLAGELGVGRSVGPNSPLVSALDRLIVFRHAAIVGDAYRVNVAVPRLSAKQVDRLPAHLRARHPGLGAVIAEGAERPVVYQLQEAP